MAGAGFGRRSDALVVLGCRVEPTTGELSATLARRAAWAVAAFRAGLANVVIASGGRSWNGHVEANVVAHHLIESGIPKEAVFPELSSLTTAENAFFTRDLLYRLGMSRATVITCSWHMRRALSCFLRVGIDASPLPVPAPSVPPLALAYRSIHERVSTRLDLWNLSRFVEPPGARTGSPRSGHPFDGAHRSGRVREMS